jgi:hypothetical protein
MPVHLLSNSDTHTPKLEVLLRTACLVLPITVSAMRRIDTSSLWVASAVEVKSVPDGYTS